MSVAIYVRTPEGQAAAYDQVSAMPRKLRSLLKVIDGKTSEAVFTTSLRAFGDVRGLLVSLTNSGLIRPLSAAELRASVAEPATQPAQLVTRPAIFAPPSTTATTSTQVAAQPTGFEPTMTTSNTQPMFASTEMVNSSVGAEVSLAKQMALSGALQAMSDFVLTHVPQHSFVVLNELEGIVSFEQLAVLLGGYEFMVRDAGEPAQQHLGYIRQVLKEWM